ncbi:replication protein A 32 kDa subunit-like [Diretmus argenteus]
MGDCEVQQDSDRVSTYPPPGTYVKISGRLRNFKGQRSLLATNVRCPEDVNEITSHMLEVVQAHMQLFGKVLCVIKRCSHREGISFQDLKRDLGYLSITDIR